MTRLDSKPLLLATCIAMAMSLPACDAQSDDMQITRMERVLEITGTIDGDSLGGLQQAQARGPGIDQLTLLNVPGSVDDEASLTALAAHIKNSGLATLVPANGMVASGGTDMALMGSPRIIEDGACIGVHSWAEEGLWGMRAGADVPRADAVHQLYLSFYQSVEIPEEFYWFTLEVAGPDEIHWMSPAEINHFGLSQIPLDESRSETVAERQRRCDAL